MNKSPARFAEYGRHADETFGVGGECRFDICLPEFDFQTPTILEAVHDPLNAYVIRDAIVRPLSSLVIKGDRLLAPREVFRNAERLRHRRKSLGFYENGSAQVTTNANEHIAHGIFLGGEGAENWFHFLLEILPKVILARRLPREFDHFPLLVPKGVLAIEPMAQCLEALRGDRRIQPFGLNRWNNHVGTLVLIDSPTYGPYNLSAGEWPNAPDYRLHTKIVRRFARELSTKLVPDLGQEPAERRVFIRRNSGLRAFNQDELIEVARQFDFEVVSPEVYSIEDQVRCFRETKFLVGMSGAAWTNLVFTKPGLRGLSWLPAPYRQFSSFSNLAHAMGGRIDFLESSIIGDFGDSTDINQATYHVDPAAFKDALGKVVGDVPSQSTIVAGSQLVA